MPTASSPPATFPPELTADEIEQIRADVAAAQFAGWQAFDESLGNPSDETALRHLAETSTSAFVEELVSNRLLFYTANGLAERPNPAHPATLVSQPETLRLDADAAVAWMDYCYASTNLLVEIGGNPDGTDKVHDDRVAVVLGTDRLVRSPVDGRWLVDAGGVTREVKEGETDCPT